MGATVRALSILGSRSRALGLCIGGMALVCLTAPGAARATLPPPPMVTSPIDFSGSYPIDGLPPFSHSNRIGYVSCPSTGMCVALDDNGNVLTSADPSSATDSWRITPLPIYGDDGLQCPTTSFCAGLADSNANGEQAVITSTDPSGGSNAWQIYTPDDTMNDISCPSADFCAGVSAGEVLTTTDPTGGAGTWHATQYTTDQNPSWYPVITCASASLCLIATGSGIYVSADPSGGPAAWTFESGVPYRGFSCPTAQLCIGTDGSSVAVSTDPAGGASTWKATQLAQPNLNSEPIVAVTCTADGFCLAAMRDGSLETSHDPQGGSWTAVSGQVPGQTVDVPGWSSAIACPADSLCLAGVGNGDVAASTDPAGPTGSWPAQDIDGYNIPTGVSCPSDGLCVAVDDNGNVLSSTQPEDQGLWPAAHIDSSPIEDVSCIAGPLCVAADGAGGVLSSTDPGGGAAAWSRLDIDGTRPFLHISCADGAGGPVCVAIDRAGNAFTSIDPLGGAGAWQQRQVVDTTNTSDYLTDVSCADRSLCLVSARDELWVIHDPGQADAGWQAITPGAPNEYATPYPSVSCSSSTFCTVLSAFGLYWSTDPAGGVGAWSGAEYISSVNPSSLIRCQSQTLCLAIDDDALFESSTPTVDQNSWGLAFDDQAAPSFHGPTAASCPSSQFCMVVGDAGYGWSGEGPQYVPPSNSAGGSSGTVSAQASTGTPPGAAAPTISAADRTLRSARIELRTRRATITRRRHILRLRLVCVSAGASCIGRLTLRSSHLRLGGIAYRLAAGRSRTLTIRLGANAVRLLGRSRGHRATVIVRLTSGRYVLSARLLLSLLPN